MEDEVKKLYKNAEAYSKTCSHKVGRYCDEDNYCRDVDDIIPECCGLENCTKKYKDIIFGKYFSERAQLEVLKVLIEGRWIEFAHYRKGDKGNYYAGKVDFKAHFEADDFEEVIAGLTNKLWLYLNDTDKERIRRALR